MIWLLVDRFWLIELKQVDFDQCDHSNVILRVPKERFNKR